MCKICIFAGTTEGRRLVEALSGRGARITACVATEYGEILLGAHEDVRILSGRMDGALMEALFVQEKFDLVVDATHPYAEIVTKNIAPACRNAGVEYLRLLRDSDSGEGDGVFVESAAACAEYLEGTEGSILLTTGSKELPAFRALAERIHARVLPMQASLEACTACGVTPDRIIAMQGPFDEEMNLALLRATKAKFLVTKDTGGAGGYAAKISAAKKAGAQAVIIGRPAQRDGLGFAETIALLEGRFPLAKTPKKAVLAGIGMGNPETRTLGMERALREAGCLIGARRMLEAVDCAGKETHIAVAAADIARIIHESPCRSFAVLLSGDTGFYSGAKKLADELRDIEVEILPGIGSLQYFCARLRRSWEDVRPVSLHGRDCDFIREVSGHPAVFALVGGEGGASHALSRLQNAGLGGLNVHIGERLGYPDERITHGSADELAGATFDPLSVLLVENPRWREEIMTHGLPDEAFDRDETPMTKSEVRSISLSKLALTRGAVLWDIGSGSGSVSVEAALQATQGRVYAIEMKEKAIALTRRNAGKFHLSNLELVCGRAPEALEALPAPSHAFIGGSTGSMREIIACLLRKNPQVRIVINTVTLETLAELTEIAGEFDFCDIAEVQISKPRALGRYHLMTAQNPVFIFTLQNGASQ
ncbi:MAG: precorrin-6A reductase [Clostridia bacterium]|nr:precorrin-6A reductase [Clostridia bacterium]